MFVVTQPRRGANTLHTDDCPTRKRSKVFYRPLINGMHVEYYENICVCAAHRLAEVNELIQAARDERKEYDARIRLEAYADELERMHPLLGLRDAIAAEYAEPRIEHYPWDDYWTISIKGRDDLGSSTIKFEIDGSCLDITDINNSTGFLRIPEDVYKFARALQIIEDFDYVRGL